MKRIGPGATLFFVLLALTLICAIVVVRARTPDLVLEETGELPAQFSPTGPGPDPELELAFFVRESDEHAVVAIVDGEEDVVRTLDPDVPLVAGEEVAFGWDGRTDEGRPVPSGRYRLAVTLPAHDRSMIWPQRITVGARPAELGDRAGEGDHS